MGRLASGLTGLALTATLTACGSEAAPAPAPTSTKTASPAPSPSPSALRQHRTDSPGHAGGSQGTHPSRCEGLRRLLLAGRGLCAEHARHVAGCRHLGSNLRSLQSRHQVTSRYRRFRRSLCGRRRNRVPCQRLSGATRQARNCRLQPHQSAPAGRCARQEDRRSLGSHIANVDGLDPPRRRLARCRL